MEKVQNRITINYYTRDMYIVQSEIEQTYKKILDATLE